VTPTSIGRVIFLVVKNSPFDVEKRTENKSIVPFVRLIRSHGRVALFIASMQRLMSRCRMYHGRVIKKITKIRKKFHFRQKLCQFSGTTVRRHEHACVSFLHCQRQHFIWTCLRVMLFETAAIQHPKIPPWKKIHSHRESGLRRL
jgi:hypothetical protein